jgi:hypothetical protein
VRPGSARGASAVEYILVLSFVALAGVVGFGKLGPKIKCRVATATELFGGAAAACGDSAAGPEVAANDPAPGTTGGEGPPPGSVCVNGSCTKPGSCFVAGTRVRTFDGEAPIESIAVGTLVRARDEAGTTVGWKPVLRTFARTASSLVALTFGAEGARETLEVTPEHRLRSATRGWVTARELVPGDDELVDADGRTLPIVAAVSLPGEVAVYNLEVADFHTYFVGAQAIWAHNACGPTQNPDGSYSVNDFPGLTLNKNPGLSEEYGGDVFDVTNGPHAGQQLFYEGGSYYWIGGPNDGENAQVPLATAHPPQLNNAGGTTYNYVPEPGVQVIPLSDLNGVTMRPKPKDSTALQSSMQAGVPIPPIVIKVDSNGQYQVTDGFTRLLAARALGLPNIPVVIVH